MDAEAYTLVKTSIKRTLNIDLENYKEDQMKRRLDSWLVRSHMPTWKEYLSAASDDAKELERFRNYLTINVTEFFRDPNRWEQVRNEILPYLIKNSAEQHQGSPLKLWSAGCSIGVEAYTMAMMMEESFPSQKYSLLATDLDRGALAKAKSGGPYGPEDIRNLSTVQQKLHLKPSSPFFVTEKLQKNIQFQEQNLLEDRFQGDFDLIVCRNVVIYFTTVSKDVLYAKFSNALRRGGVLFVGGTEIISGSTKFGLQNFGISFYKKV